MIPHNRRRRRKSCAPLPASSERSSQNVRGLSVRLRIHEERTPPTWGLHPPASRSELARSDVLSCVVGGGHRDRMCRASPVGGNPRGARCGPPPGTKRHATPHTLCSRAQRRTTTYAAGLAARCVHSTRAPRRSYDVLWIRYPYSVVGSGPLPSPVHTRLVRQGECACSEVLSLNQSIEPYPAMSVSVRCIELTACGPLLRGRAERLEWVAWGNTPTPRGERIKTRQPLTYVHQWWWWWWWRTRPACLPGIDAPGPQKPCSLRTRENPALRCPSQSHPSLTVGTEVLTCEQAKSPERSR